MVLKKEVVEVRERVQNRAAQQERGTPGPRRRPSAAEGSRWFMYDILRGGGQKLTRRCESSRIDCSTIDTVGLRGVHGAQQRLCQRGRPTNLRNDVS